MTQPTKIMLIRHAERPAKVGAPHGVTIEGHTDVNSLSAPGWQRAGALATFFAPTHGPLQDDALATPLFLFASQVGHRSPSKREQETLTPLSEILGLDISAEHQKQDHAPMVKSVLGCDGVVLICWDHKALPAVANEILDDDTTAPQKWKRKRFDLVWVFDWNSSTKSYDFKQVPQLLLTGDKKKPMKTKKPD